MLKLQKIKHLDGFASIPISGTIGNVKFHLCTHVTGITWEWQTPGGADRAYGGTGFLYSGQWTMLITQISTNRTDVNNVCKYQETGDFTHHLSDGYTSFRSEKCIFEKEMIKYSYSYSASASSTLPTEDTRELRTPILIIAFLP